MGARCGPVENMVIDPTFWRGRRVFLTGHTGFKGAWMSLLLNRLGAEVYGFALPPRSECDLFVVANVERDIHHTIGDIRDLDFLRHALSNAKPEVVIHMAAQSLVLLSYAEPVETYATNVMGTVNLLEVARGLPSVRAAIIITSDKCYDNLDWLRGYRETDALGGHDPYGNSKGCAELVTDAYRRSFFSAVSSAAVASARAGNVVGGGDWARHRLVPDAMRAFTANSELAIRNPDAVRPWQHVFDPIVAYLRLAEHLVTQGRAFAEAWNFGPASGSEVPVSVVVEMVASLWGEGARWRLDREAHPHEAGYLKLDCAKARGRLGWFPLLDLREALVLTVEWYRAARDGQDIRALSLRQIDRFIETHLAKATCCSTN